MNIKNKPDVKRERVGEDFREDISWPEGTPDDIILYMNSIKDKYKDVENLTVESYWSGYESCDYRVVGIKYETDEEMKSRIEHEEVILKEWEEDYVEWMETKGKQKAAQEQAKLEEQLRQYNLLKEKLEKAGKLT